MPTQLLPSDTSELVPVSNIGGASEPDYYTALRDYVAGLSSPYGTYTPEVSQLLRSTAGSPTGRLGSGTYDVMASNPYAALANPDAPIDPGILAAITSAVNPNAPYEQNVTYQFNPFSEGKYASSNAIDVLYNTPIRLTDAQGNVLISGTGFQTAEQIAKAVQDAYASGQKQDLRIDTGMPGDTTGDTFKTASIVSPMQDGLKTFAIMAALATLGSGLIAPAGAGAGAGAGAAGAAGTGAAAAGTGVGAGTLAALAPVAGEIVVPGVVGGGLGAAGAAGLGAAAATGLALAQSGALSPATAATQTPVTPEPAAPTPIEVVGAPTSSMADIAAYLGLPAVTAPVVAGALTPTTPQPTATEPTAPEPNAPEPITVTAPTTVPTSISPAILAGLTAAAPVAAITSAGTGTTPTTTTEAKPSLFDQILKYGSLASLAAGTIGDLFGGSGGAGGATTPYTSVLGPAPSFNRGTFQPYTGDYETYGQGPEWNFFTPTTTAPTMTAPVAAPAVPTTQTYTPLI